MRAHNSRRALRLASGLVAAGLALTAAPHALAADSGSAPGIRLTNTQAEKLAERMEVDPQNDTAEADTAKGGDDAGARLKASTEAAADITVKETSRIENVAGLATTMPVGNKQGDYFTLHSNGHAARTTADGTEQWTRSVASLYADWGVTPLRVWDKELYPPHVQMSYNAVGPFTPNSDQGYDSGDLTGDGVPDVVFTADLGLNPPVGVNIPGTTLTSGTFVTILDGKTGNTVWSKFYTYASQVEIVDGALLVAESPAYNRAVPAGSTAKLTGTRFDYADGRLTESSTWTYDTGETGPATWGALQDLGGGRAAVAWNIRKAATTTASGRTLVLDVNDGTVQWRTDSPLYVRQLRVDDGRGQLVAVEQSDYTDGVRYEIAAYDLSDGRRTTLDTRVNVLPTAITVGDLAGDGNAEYAIAESSLTDSLFVNANTIRVLDGDDPETALWQHTTKRDASNPENGPSTWKLDVVAKKLVAAASDDAESGTAANPGSRFASLTVFSGKGKVRWRTKGATASPTFQDVFKDKSGRHIRVVDADQNVRTYAFTDGAQEQLTPLQGAMAYGKTVDVDGDKKADLVEGGTSNGVWAYSGTSLLAGKPKMLWRATLPGAVHRIETADVTGDRTPEIVVAADSAVVVLDSRTGAVLTTIDGGGQFVRSVALSDVDGNKKADILVPTDKLRVYKGNGKALWTYAAPDSAGDVQFSDTSAGDGKVYVQYAATDALKLDAPTMRAVQLDAKTGTLGWDGAPEAPATAQDGKVRGGLLNNAVYASPAIPYADGHAVVYTWIAWAPAGAAGTDAMSPFNVVEIRDRRTGEVLHTQVTGGLWTHSKYLDGDGALVESGTASLYSFKAEHGKELVFLLPPAQDATWVTAPSGEKVLATGGDGGVYFWDPAILAGDVQYPDYLGKAPAAGAARNYVTGDLDGDGKDEAVMLNFDHRGVDRTAELIGGRYSVPNNSTPCTIALKLS